ncbi:dATP/dGTP pyrophosphohydrolase domain-containing protein [Niabella aurantiaca]|uniref:dATP/dGTP pyrophosphohydrolase domain-containing protein n=1 Tax=Niabella aurantiaca TaxID=379900 RepID=UPI000381CEB6|nr:dATP/dGTP pyrophosphohydrolase domain-containing protein [Niabella aurantiaca]
MTHEQFLAITEWQDKTFPDSTVHSRLAHLKDEIREIEDEVMIMGDPREEFADAFFLLFGAAYKAGMSYDDIVDFIDKKFQKNLNRKWGKPDERGVVNHIDNEPRDDQGRTFDQWAEDEFCR